MAKSNNERTIEDMRRRQKISQLGLKFFAIIAAAILTFVILSVINL